MRKTIRKAFFVWNFDKEEKWLNEMAAKGLCLVSVGFCRYEFEDCLPGEYSIRLELLEHSPKHPESANYIAFLEDTGAEHIGTFTRWVYYRKKTENGPFDLFSDNSSRLKYLSRIISLVLFITVMNLIIGAYNIFIYFTIGIPINLLGFINLAIGIWGLFGFLHLRKKKIALKKDQQIFE